MAEATRGVATDISSGTAFPVLLRFSGLTFFVFQCVPLFGNNFSTLRAAETTIQGYNLPDGLSLSNQIFMLMTPFIHDLRSFLFFSASTPARNAGFSLLALGR